MSPFEELLQNHEDSYQCDDVTPAVLVRWHVLTYRALWLLAPPPRAQRGDYQAVYRWFARKGPIADQSAHVFLWVVSAAQFVGVCCLALGLLVLAMWWWG